MPNSKGPRRGTRNKYANHPRERGFSPPQRAISEFEVGDSVHLATDPSVREGRFHHRFNGQTGTIAGKQGSAYQVTIKDGGKEKTLMVRPAHLKPTDE